MAEDHHRFMRTAIEEAAKAGEGGNRAVGAVIVRGGEVVARGGNCRESAADPLGHAETSALRNMAATSGNLDFSGCTLYTTLEPCPMCCGAIAVNGIEIVVVGAMHTAANRRWGGYTVRKVTEMIGQGTQIVDGVLADECNAVLAEWDAKQGR